MTATDPADVLGFGEEGSPDEAPRAGPEIPASYQDRYDEDTRLTRSPHGRLELARTQELLRRYLPRLPP